MFVGIELCVIVTQNFPIKIIRAVCSATLNLAEMRLNTNTFLANAEPQKTVGCLINLWKSWFECLLFLYRRYNKCVMFFKIIVFSYGSCHSVAIHGTWGNYILMLFKKIETRWIVSFTEYYTATRINSINVFFCCTVLETAEKHLYNCYLIQSMHNESLCSTLLWSILLSVS